MRIGTVSYIPKTQIQITYLKLVSMIYRKYEVLSFDRLKGHLALSPEMKLLIETPLPSKMPFMSPWENIECGHWRDANKQDKEFIHRYLYIHKESYGLQEKVLKFIFCMRGIK